MGVIVSEEMLTEQLEYENWYYGSMWSEEND